MDPIEMLKQHHAQLASLEQRFQQYVHLTKGNFEEVAKTLGAAQLEIAGLKAALQQLGQTPGAGPVMQPANAEVVAHNPATGAPITKAQLDADPKLRLRLAFSENDA